MVPDQGRTNLDASPMTMPQPDALPLIRHFMAPSALACVHGQLISAQQFIGHAVQLAARMPQGQHVLNLCEDRYHFAVGFAAALIAHKITLIPASRATEAIAQLERDFDGSYRLTDRMLSTDLEDISPALGLYAIPDIPADQPAAILFTSGSTGQPSAHTKTWGMLVQGADQLQRAIGIAPNSCVVGTVPPQHMFGLESTIVFPLQWGCTIHHGRPLLPADIEQVVNMACAPVWLMTTPLHLRACIAGATTMRGMAGAVSATMPLDQAVAQTAEQALNCPLHEIYGCTEAGIIATRRPAQNPVWQLCPDFSLRVDGEQGWLDGARVAQSLRLGDSIVMHSRGSFSLHGRVGDMIKLAGKRTSLDALNAALLSIDGVTDGTFYRPDAQDGRHHDDQRLAAFIVSPQRTTQDVIAALRKQIDSVFIPRPLWKVAQLPRDPNGKLARADLARLAATLSSQHVHDIPLHSSGVIAPDHPALDGHFPDDPIVPGALLLNEVMRLAARTYSVSGITQAKFHAPLRPRQIYAINLSKVSSTSIKFVIEHGGTLIASGLLQRREVGRAAA
jgi:acyl-CoA synthetase (AMP-forming)/AMP-acid ligase II